MGFDMRLNKPFLLSAILISVASGASAATVTQTYNYATTPTAWTNTGGANPPSPEIYSVTIGDSVTPQFTFDTRLVLTDHYLTSGSRTVCDQYFFGICSKSHIEEYTVDVYDGQMFAKLDADAESKISLDPYTSILPPAGTNFDKLTTDSPQWVPPSHVYLSFMLDGQQTHGTATFSGVDHQVLDSISYQSVDLGPGVTGVPEPASWALMIAGFGGIGAVLRRRPKALVA